MIKTTFSNIVDPKIQSPCDMAARQIPDPVAIVMCPAGCLKNKGKVWGTNIYTDDSSICRAGIHLGVITDEGGAMIMEKKPGQDSYEESIRNGVKTTRYGSWTASFVLRTLDSTPSKKPESSEEVPDVPTTSTQQPPSRLPSVQSPCDMAARQIPDPVAIVMCPAGCLKNKGQVWGTNIYTDDSSICRAGIHLGVITDEGGAMIMEKKPGQDNYEESIRNGVKTTRYGHWTASFVLRTLDSSPSKKPESSEEVPDVPTTSTQQPPSRLPSVQSPCDMAARQIPDPVAIVMCPAGCLKNKGQVWGTNIYTDDSSICRAGIHLGVITDEGGAMIMEKKPGQDNYEESIRNGVKTTRYGHWTASFVLRTLDSSPSKKPESSEEVPDVPTTSTQQPPSRLPSVQSPCDMAARQIPDPVAIVMCPAGCLKNKGQVWGTNIYTDDSSICRAGIHLGVITDEGGAMIMEKKPGQDNYEESIRNGVKTTRYGRWTSSFVLRTLDSSPSKKPESSEEVPDVSTTSTQQPPSRLPSVQSPCDMAARQIPDPVAIVMCPAGCLKNKGQVWGTNIYTDDSSICRAGIHLGVITDEGGAMIMEKKPGQDNYEESIRNGVKTTRYGRWTSSFVLRTLDSSPSKKPESSEEVPDVPTTSTQQPPSRLPSVQSPCDMAARQIPDPVAIVMCPAGCLKNKGQVWGTNIYTDDSSICRAGIHLGVITDEGGAMIMEKKPGQDNYEESIRNGVKTTRYGRWTASFVLRTLDSSPSKKPESSEEVPDVPTTSTQQPPSRLPSVQSPCDMAARQIPDPVAIVMCPAGCLKNKGQVWGTNIYTDDSSICRAGIHLGVITDEGGAMIMEKKPGQDSYEESIRNGVKTTRYGRWTASFVLRTLDPSPSKKPESSEEVPDVPTTSTQQPPSRLPSVQSPCDMAARQIPDPVAIVMCPAGCLKNKGQVWGTNIYTDDSSICRAGIHLGVITDEGGAMIMEKKPGQDNYEESIRNGVKTTRYGHWTASFVLRTLDSSPSKKPESSEEVPDVPTTSTQQPPSRLPSVQSPCDMAARQIPDPVAIVMCPAGCLKNKGQVWGTNIYTDDSSICRAGIHLGVITDEGGAMIMEKKPGQDNYEESIRNGVKTTRFGRWTASFVLRTLDSSPRKKPESSEKVPDVPTTSTQQPPSRLPSVQSPCDMAARQIPDPVAIVMCPAGCLKNKGQVWGTNIYTDDSSICRAGIHLGVITDEGGAMIMEKKPGQDNYEESIRNGVKTTRFGRWTASFVLRTLDSSPSKKPESSEKVPDVPATSTQQPPSRLPSVHSPCDMAARQIPDPVAIVMCPAGCLKNKGQVWGTNIYTDDSSICRAGIHLGVITDEGGAMIMEKKPGQDNYEESIRNGVKTTRYGRWTASFVLRTLDSSPSKKPESSEEVPDVPTTSTQQPPSRLPSVQSPCDMAARQIPDPVAIVMCPAGCLKNKGQVWGTNIYTDDSSICGAGIHSGVITDEGGAMIMEKKPGQDNYEESIRNGVKTTRYGRWTASFVLRTLDSSPTKKAESSEEVPDVPTTSTQLPPSRLPSVPSPCDMAARQIPDPVAIVMCPAGCLKNKGQVWGTNIYKDDSSICRAGIHSGVITDEGGAIIIEKKPGEDNYEESIRNGVKTTRYGRWTASFVLRTLDSSPSKKPESSEEVPNVPTTSTQQPPSRLPSVQSPCDMVARQIPDPVAIVMCPAGCLKNKGQVWGTNIYTDDSSICRAGIHLGVITDEGGAMIIEKKPGQDSYEESIRNGVKTTRYGRWTASFVLRTLDSSPSKKPESSEEVPDIPTTSTQQPPSRLPSVQSPCDTSARQIPDPVAIVICPAECLNKKGKVSGTNIYTDDSSICRAGIHLGLITDEGGAMILEKKPGQDSYDESERNGVKTTKYGQWTGSFILRSIELPPSKKTESSSEGQQQPTRLPSVQSPCDTSARQIPDPIAIVICPAGCLNKKGKVTGTNIYTDDSSICRAGIHLGLITDEGGAMILEKKPGQDNYDESERNGVKTTKYGQWTGSFILSSIELPPTKKPESSSEAQQQPSHLPSVQALCEMAANQIPDEVAIVKCPAGCLNKDGNVWGTNIFTDDSSICRAGIHSGLITNKGGPMIMEKKPGQETYEESERNGVKTTKFGCWNASFVLHSLRPNKKPESSEDVPDVPTASPQEPPSHLPSAKVDCSSSAEALTTPITIVICPPGCRNEKGNVWGFKIYTDHSSVCRAAIQAGMLPDGGGSVVVRKIPGQSSYETADKNGIKSDGYGAWTGSFAFLSPTVVSPTASPQYVTSDRLDSNALQQPTSNVHDSGSPQQPVSNLPNSKSPQQPTSNESDLSSPKQPTRNVPGSKSPQQPSSNEPQLKYPQQLPSNIPDYRSPQQPATNIPGSQSPHQPLSNEPDLSYPGQPTINVPDARSPHQPSNNIPGSKTSQNHVSNIPGSQSPQQSPQQPLSSEPDLSYPGQPTINVPDSRSPQQPLNNIPGSKTPQKHVTNIPGSQSPQKPSNNEPDLSYPRQPTRIVPDSQSQEPTFDEPDSSSAQQPYTKVPGSRSPQQPTINIPGSRSPQQPIGKVPDSKSPKQPTNNVPGSKYPQQPTGKVSNSGTPQNPTRTTPGSQSPQQPTDSEPDLRNPRQPTSYPRKPTTFVPDSQSPQEPTFDEPDSSSAQQPYTKVPGSRSPQQPTINIPGSQSPQQPIGKVPDSKSPKQPINNVPGSKYPQQPTGKVSNSGTPQNPTRTTPGSQSRQQPTDSEPDLRNPRQPTSYPRKPTTFVPDSQSPQEPTFDEPDSSSAQQPYTKVPGSRSPQQPTINISGSRSPQQPIGKVPDSKSPKQPTNNVPGSKYPQQPTGKVSNSGTPQNPTRTTPGSQSPQQPKDSEPDLRNPRQPTSYPRQPTRIVPDSQSQEPTFDEPDSRSAQQPYTKVPGSRSPQQPTINIPGSRSPQQPIGKVPDSKSPKQPTNNVPGSKYPQQPTGKVSNSGTPQNPTRTTPGSQSPQQPTDSEPDLRNPRQPTSYPRKPTTFVPDSQSPQEPTFDEPDSSSAQQPYTKVPGSRSPQQPTINIPGSRSPQQPIGKVPDSKSPKQPTNNVPGSKYPQQPTGKVSNSGTPQNPTRTTPGSQSPQQPTESEPDLRNPRQPTSYPRKKTTTFVPDSQSPQEPTFDEPDLSSAQQPSTKVPGSRSPQQQKNNIPGSESSQQSVSKVPGSRLPQKPTNNVPGSKSPQQPTGKVPKSGTPQQPTSNIPGSRSPQQPTSREHDLSYPRQPTSYVPGSQTPQQPSNNNPDLSYHRQPTRIVPYSQSPEEPRDDEPDDSSSAQLPSTKVPGSRSPQKPTVNVPGSKSPQQPTGKAPISGTPQKPTRTTPGSQSPQQPTSSEPDLSYPRQPTRYVPGSRSPKQPTSSEPDLSYARQPSNKERYLNYPRQPTRLVPESQSSKEPTNDEPDSSSPQLPLTKVPGLRPPQQPTGSEPDLSYPRQPTRYVPGSRSPQQPTSSEPDLSYARQPTRYEPGSRSPQQPSNKERDLNYPRQPTRLVPDSLSSKEPTKDEPDTSSPQLPSTKVPGSRPPQQPTINTPGSQSPQQPIGRVPDSKSPKQPTNNVPGSNSPQQPTGKVYNSGTPQKPTRTTPSSKSPQQPTGSEPNLSYPRQPTRYVPGSQSPQQPSNKERDLSYPRQPTRIVPNSQSPKEPTNDKPDSSSPQLPSTNVPGSRPPQQPTINTPGSQSPKQPIGKVPDSKSPKQPTNNVPGSNSPQQPTGKVSNSGTPQKPNRTTPGSKSPQQPTGSEPDLSYPRKPTRYVPGSQSPQQPSNKERDLSYPRQPTRFVPDSQSPDEQTDDEPDSSSPQLPSTKVPGSRPPQQPIINSPGSQSPQQPIGKVPDSRSPKQPINNVPGSKSPQQPTGKVSNSGTPQKPTSTTPGSQSPQQSTSSEPDLSYPRQPTRYVPGSRSLQQPTSSEPDLRYPQQPTSYVPDSRSPQQPSSNEPDLSYPQQPSRILPDSQSPQDPTINEPDSSSAQQPAIKVPSSRSPQQPTINRPGSQASQQPVGKVSDSRSPKQPTNNVPGSRSPLQPIGKVPGSESSQQPTNSEPDLSYPRQPTRIVPDSQSPQEPTIDEPDSRSPKQPTINIPGSQSLRQPISNLPNSRSPKQPTNNVTGSKSPQQPTGKVPNSETSQEPTSNTPSLQSPQQPTSSEPDLSYPQQPTSFVLSSQSPKQPSSNDPDSSYPQQPTRILPDSQSPQEPTFDEPDSSSAQQPSTKVPGSRSPQQPTTDIPGSRSPQQPIGKVAGSGSPQQATSSKPDFSYPPQSTTVVPDSQSPQEPTFEEPDSSSAQQPSTKVPGSRSPQQPTINRPGSQSPQQQVGKVSDSISPKQHTNNVPGSKSPQQPSGKVPNSGTPQQSTSNTPGSQSPQKPKSKEPDSQSPQEPTFDEPGSSTAQQPTNNEPDLSYTRQPTSSLPGSSSPQQPTTDVPDSRLPQQPTSNMPGSLFPQQPIGKVPDSISPQQPRNSVPGSTSLEQPTGKAPNSGRPQQHINNVPGSGLPQQPLSNDPDLSYPQLPTEIVPDSQSPQESTIDVPDPQLSQNPTSNVPGSQLLQQHSINEPGLSFPQQLTSSVPGSRSPQDPSRNVPDSQTIPKVTALCSSVATHLTAPVTIVSCPAKCLSGSGSVWGSDTYTDDSSICRAAIHAGRLTDHYGTVVVELKPGKDSYEASIRNGIESFVRDSWTRSFTFISPIMDSTSTSPVLTINPTPSVTFTSNLPKVTALCSSTADYLTKPITEVMCPAGCLDESGNVWGSRVYTDDSSICRAAIHAGEITDDGGCVFVELKPGQDSYEASTNNGVKSSDHESWTGSFVFTSAPAEQPTEKPKHTKRPPVDIPPPPVSSVTKVTALCSSTAIHLIAPITDVACPAECLNALGNVWGTEIYTDSSSICGAAIHSGRLQNKVGGLVKVVKMPGQGRYEGSNKNGVTSYDHEEWTGSFAFLSPALDLSATGSEPATEQSTQNTYEPSSNIPIATALCSSDATHLPAPFTQVICPAGCLSEQGNVWGTDTYTDDSSICRAAIHAGMLTDEGGIAFVKKIPGQSHYEASARNGIKASDFEEWTGSFIFKSSPDVEPTESQLPTSTLAKDSDVSRHGLAWQTTWESKAPKVTAKCSWKGKDLPAPITLVICPAGCLTDRATVWGSETYAEESSVCEAAIHAGIVTNNGGPAIVQKTPGQTQYVDATKNRIIARSHGESSGSFVFRSQLDFPSITFTDVDVSSQGLDSDVSRHGLAWQTTWESKAPKVTAKCSWKGKDLPAPVTLVICPAGCLTDRATVWGSETYAEESSVCEAAIHAGIVTNNGGPAIVQKTPGQTQYVDATKNRIIARSHGESSGSFVFRSQLDFPSITFTDVDVSSQGLAGQTTQESKVPKVSADCSMAGKDLSALVTLVTCLEGCLNEKGEVWGTEIYTDASSICRAAIHAGRIGNDGGEIKVKKKPGQNSYEESHRNGVKTKSMGEWSGSFAFISSYEYQITTTFSETSYKDGPTEITWGSEPSTVVEEAWDSEAKPVPVSCTMVGRDLPGPVTIITCPEGCLSQKGEVWGSDVYTDDSSICRAAIHSGCIDNKGGQAIVQKKAGEKSYVESNRNGVKTRKKGEWSESFGFISSFEYQTISKHTKSFHNFGPAGEIKWESRPPTEIKWESKLPTGEMKWESNPPQGEIKWESRSPTEIKWESKLPTGEMKWESNPPQEIKWESKIPTGETKWESNAPTVSVTCSSTAKELSAQITIVACPKGCISEDRDVWGTDVYTDVSSICRAAIHAGKLNDAGKVAVQKMPGQSSYRESTRNGVKTKSMGAWSGAFMFSPSFQFKTSSYSESTSYSFPQTGMTWQSPPSESNGNRQMPSFNFKETGSNHGKGVPVVTKTKGPFPLKG
ncbi:mucin-12-like [Bombina bombina]|uniref:mucin-12-like n=1 Tax=Bombina bombina TaxID=8345 RepID=UPI00235ADBA6|nr:mucin-12-like [Bombina bombina]